MLIHKYSAPLKPDRVVILGSGGFLAPELRRLLEGAAIETLPIGSKEIDLISGSAAEKLGALLRPTDRVVMAAALTPEKGRDNVTLMKNLRMGESVCAALLRTPVAQFVYISSDGVYDGRFSSLLNEDSTCEPTDLYTLMHIGREKMLAQTCRGAGIPYAIVRPCAIYGPGDTHNSYGPNRFIRMATREEKIALFGEGEERRHHVYVTDAAEIIKLCLLHGSTGILNAITGQAVSFREVAQQIAAQSEAPVALEFLPRSGPITHRHFDTSALVRAFPSFEETPLNAGIAMAYKRMLQ